MSRLAAKGRPPFQDRRRMIEGIIHRYRAGIPWRDLPGSFGPRQTVGKRHRRFSGDGTWDKILTGLLSQADSTGRTWPSPQGALSNYKSLLVEPADHMIGRSCGGLTTKIHALRDAKMRPRSYSSKANRKLLRDRGIQAVIPERSDQINNQKRLGATGGRPPTLDTEAYKRRNVIKRCFATFTQWRGSATRWDKPAPTYRGDVTLRTITN